MRAPSTRRTAAGPRRRPSAGSSAGSARCSACPRPVRRSSRGSGNGLELEQAVDDRTGRKEPHFAAIAGASWADPYAGGARMRLRRLLDPGLTVQGAGWREVEITALAADSRAVRAGTLFAALPGSRADGRAFIDDAARARRRSGAQRPVARRPDPAGAADPGRQPAPPPRADGRAPVRAPAALHRRGHGHQRQDLGRRLHPADLDRPRARRRLARHARPGCRRGCADRAI